MEILAIIVVLLILLFAVTLSSARSYFARGRLAGMEEATLEVVRGVRVHYDVAGHAAPAPVTEAIEAVQSFARGATSEKSIQRYQARLWSFGDAVGSACWRRGFETCRQQMTPRDDRIRVDFSTGELVQLAELAHLGFKKMMPNDRGIEMQRFGGEEQALRVTRALERLEFAIPERQRPTGHSATRQNMIRNWWPLQRKSA